MKDGYIKVAAATPKVKVADTVYNGQLIKALMKECTDNGAKVVVFPELCITGYTCQDLFWQDKLIAAAEDELIGIADYSRSLDGIFFIGLPYEINGMLYNMAAVVAERCLPWCQRHFCQTIMSFMRQGILHREKT